MATACPSAHAGTSDPLTTYGAAERSGTAPRLPSRWQTHSSPRWFPLNPQLRKQAERNPRRLKTRGSSADVGSAGDIDAEEGSL
jgi:hypothetical protein